jgi:hypothetical protein
MMFLFSKRSVLFATLSLALSYSFSSMALDSELCRQQCEQQKLEVERTPLPAPTTITTDEGGRRYVRIKHRLVTDTMTEDKKVKVVQTDWSLGQKDKCTCECEKMVPPPMEREWQQDLNAQQQSGEITCTMKTEVARQEAPVKTRKTVIENNCQVDTETEIFENNVRVIKEWWEEREEPIAAKGCVQKASQYKNH